MTQSTPMTTVFVRCREENHAGDAKFSSRLMMAPGVVDVIETFVRNPKTGKDFCMAAEINGDKKAVEKVVKMLRKMHEVGRVWVPRKEQVPF